MSKHVEEKENLVELKYLFVGKRRIRYLQIPLSLVATISTTQSENLESKKILGHSEYYLFFLGSDVLGKTKLPTKNIARQHLQLSKLGYCCRLSFPCRISGVSGHTKIAWFYDLNGLMRSAFEYYEKEEQVLVMRCFFNLWSVGVNCKLPREIELSSNDILREEIVLTVLVNQGGDCSLCEKNQILTDHNSMSTEATRCFVSSKEIATQTNIDAKTNKSMQTECPDIQVTDMEVKSNETDKAENELKSRNSDSNISQLLLSELSFCLQKFFQHASSNIFFFKIYSLIETFLHLLGDEFTYIEQTNTGIFPFHLLIQYANLKNTIVNKENSDNPDVILDKECALHVMSTWLAMQFHNYHNDIANHMDHFKHEQLRENQISIDPVEVLSKHNLFPSCMIQFLKQWIGSNEHDAVPKFLFARMMLVLELLNDSLLTGIGHVVYAKLKCNNSM